MTKQNKFLVTMPFSVKKALSLVAVERNVSLKHIILEALVRHPEINNQLKQTKGDLKKEVPDILKLYSQTK